MNDEERIAVLKRAIKVLRKGKWSKWENARTKRGKPCRIHSKDARAWSGTGAITKACIEGDFASADVLVEVSIDLPRRYGLNKGMYSLLVYNDLHATRKRDVIRIFKKTIKRLS